MAGLPSHTKKKQSARSGKSVNREGDSFPRTDIENARDPKASLTLQLRQSNAPGSNHQRNRSPERLSSTQGEASAQSTRSTNSPPDLLWITTDKPADFKDAKIQRMISRHVMRDYQQKDQSKKDSNRASRQKNSAKSPSDDDASVTSSTSQISLTPLVDIGRVYHSVSTTDSIELIHIGLWKWRHLSKFKDSLRYTTMLGIYSKYVLPVADRPQLYGVQAAP